MIDTLYLTRNGLLEPLGQSQVFAYLQGLSREYRVTLITHEKDVDWADKVRLAKAQADCDAIGITWLPQKFRSRPKLIGPALAMLRMIWLVWREVKRQDVRLIHARSYVPAAVAMMVGKLTNVPFIFDMRALWPEELITAHRLRRNSLLHRAIVAAERTCLRDAAGVVSLTQAAAAYLRDIYPEELADQRLLVIPTCADLSRFTPASRPADGPRIYGCIGTVLSGWFRTDWLTTWLLLVSERDPSARFEIITKDDADHVRSAIDPDERLGNRLVVRACFPEEMPVAVRDHNVSVMFFTDGLGKLGSSPTRMAEILGCGLPVVANEGVGDVAQIIRDYKVGVLVRSNSDDDMNDAWSELERLMLDAELATRCRQAAEDIFSLQSGTDAYLSLYRSILDQNKCVA